MGVMEVKFRYPSGHPINAKTDFDRVRYAMVDGDERDVAVLVKRRDDLRCERCPRWEGGERRADLCPHEAAVADEIEHRWSVTTASESLREIAAGLDE